MSRLIDADALIGELHTEFFYDGRDRTRMYECIQSQAEIANQTEESAQNVQNEDFISRKTAIDAISDLYWMYKKLLDFKAEIDAIFDKVNALPFAQLKQKYTNKELHVFMNGISIRLLSLRSAQHWKHDDETAEEIKFLERLYKKVESEVTQ